MRFLTLRPIPSRVTGFMPGARDKLVRGGHRNFEWTVDVIEAPGGEVDQRDLIAPEADGLACRVLSIGPDTSFELPDAASPRSAGRYVFVARGSLADGTTAGPPSLAWLPPGTSLAAPRSGHEGAVVVVLDFPAPTTET